MTRTIITLPEQDKEWIDRYSRQHKQSSAQTIREAIEQFKLKKSNDFYKKSLKKVAGIWKHKKEDGLAMQKRLRREWDERPTLLEEQK